MTIIQDHFLVEFRNDVKNVVLEEGLKRRYVIEGPFIQTNVKNVNGRIYLKEAVRPGILQYIEERVKTNRACGELNHPTPPRPYIDYERASHKIESLTEDGDNWFGRAVVTKGTPMGSIVAGLMDEGVVMGISSRATGNTRRRFDGVVEVVGNYRLTTAGDIVSDPSAPDAFLTNLMEGKEWALAEGKLVPIEEQIRTMVNKQSATVQGLDDESASKLFEYIMSLVQEKQHG